MKKIVWKSAKCIKSKKNKNNGTCTQVFTSFAQYFVDALLATITASCLCEYDATILTLLLFGQFFPFFFSEPLRFRQLERGVVTYCRCPVGRWSSAPLWGLVLSIHCCIHLAVDPALSPKSRCWKTSPQHGAATTALHCREGIGQVMSLVSSWYCAWHWGQRVQFLFKQTRKFGF